MMDEASDRRPTLTRHHAESEVKWKTMHAQPTLDDYQWLVSPAASKWLAEAAAGDRELVAQAAGMRRHLSAARVHLVLEQATLRLRARQKFSAAARMFFTPLGLAQATDEWVAAYKASRFSCGPLLDLCCGIGGDLLALASRGVVTGIDRDPVAVLLAESNLRTVVDDDRRPDSAGARLGDAAHAPLAGVAAWHIDPDRRPTGRRTTDVELHSPGVPVVERLLAASPAGAIKLAPAAVLPERWTLDAELEWISRDGECRQLVAWFGALARTPGCRRATVVAKRETSGTIRTFVGDPAVELPVAERLGRYLSEPDPAVLAADLTGALAREHGLAAVAPGVVYLTADRAAADRVLSWFEITDTLPFDLKRLKALLRQRGIGRLEVKKRGVPHDPEQVRQQLRVPGEAAATLFLVRIAGTVTAIVARRLSG
ncbi:MAG TPA: class I SAM-dependent methyltransferase [Pirellulales bacterium]|nr:class I SAM-dependent methyltransferase [Pirellulales bacterium]